MKKLTAGEEMIMAVLWKIGPATIGQIMKEMSAQSMEHMPAQSTVSTFLRILVDKKFLRFKSYGKTYEYFPLVSREEYSNQSLNHLVSSYFNNSPIDLVSQLIDQEKIDSAELLQLIEKLKHK
ncbi:MAG: BlaI/MecI/CopY family transcriptional regulator [Saprospiraceae bacterium]|nr:BlaI/MecI/CopY family transcriptional regulator [Saprospiraceae bacterium]